MDLNILNEYSSPNFGERAQLNPQRAEPSMIVLHYTGMKSAQAALQRLCDPASEVSAHYLVDEGGRVFQLVPDDKRAWHAGKSHWNGLSDINSASIGIEIVNKGHEFGYEAFPDCQIKVLSDLLKALIKDYEIRPDMIVGHSDVAPARKQDPGELFPWKGLADEGIGLWPDMLGMDMDAAADLLQQEQVLHDLLVGLGYDPDVEFATTIEAFHRHYFPEKFLQGVDSRSVNVETIARILALARQINELRDM